jgi:uncharacterized protein YoxC
MATETLSISVNLVLEKFEEIQNTIDNVAASIKQASVGMDNFAQNSIERQVQKAESLQKDVNSIAETAKSVINGISTAASLCVETLRNQGCCCFYPL